MLAGFLERRIELVLFSFETVKPRLGRGAFELAPRLDEHLQIGGSHVEQS
jgi:hypothetical protein